MRRLIIDANLLCLVIAGQCAPNAIGRHKRLREYGIGDFHKVMEIASYFDAAVTCPNVLTETSNLLANTNDDEKVVLLKGLQTLLFSTNELHTHALLACEHPAYSRLGLTDAILLTMDLSECALLTADLALALAARKDGKSAINYNWLRDQAINYDVLGMA